MQLGYFGFNFFFMVLRWFSLTPSLQSLKNLLIAGLVESGDK